MTKRPQFTNKYQRRLLSRWRRRSLLVDSAVKILSVSLVLVGLFTVISILLLRYQEMQRLQDGVEALFAAHENSVRQAIESSDAALGTVITQDLLNNPLIAGISIKAHEQILVSAFRETGVDQDGLQVRRMPISLLGSTLKAGELELIIDSAYQAEQALHKALFSSVALMLEVILVDLAVLLVLMQRVIKPIRLLSHRAQTLNIQLDEHIIPPEGNTENEIGQLANGFNRIIDDMNILLSAEQMMCESLEENERRFSSLVENTPDIIVRYNRKCQRIFVNHAYCLETGNSAEQVLNKSVDDYSIWVPEMPFAEYRARLIRVMETGVSDVMVLDWMKPDGQRISHEMHVVAEYDADGKVIGTLAIGRDITARKEAEQQLLHQASYDILTGLPNRRLFQDRLHNELARANRHAHGLGLMFIDLDRFKEVNDTLGHASGDQLLIEASIRILACVRETDIVARLAGDEFVVIITEIESAEVLERIAKKIVEAIGKPFQFANNSAFVSASIGIACYPEDAEHADSLLGCSDQAMYFAKETGKNCYRFFTSNMLENAQKHLYLATDLRVALERKQLEVYYQPILEAQTGLMLKAEALLRWHHPELGMVPPDVFIPIAEETGLIKEIGAWVFREAAVMAKCWNETETEWHRRQISINMSPRQFSDSSVDWVIDILKEFELDPAMIIIEITENLLLGDDDRVSSQLEILRNCGIEMSLDDFGTGYSAMGYLKKFNIDYLKIDRSFIRDLETDADDRAISEAIIVMSHRLGLKVIAEGVETLAQEALLSSVGCEFMQGYLYAKPMPARDFLEFMSQETVLGSVSI